MRKKGDILCVWIILLWKAKSYQEIFKARCNIFPYELLVKELPKFPKQYRAFQFFLVAHGN